MDIIITNGRILQNDGTFLNGHIGIEHGKISLLTYGENPPLRANAKKIDADNFIVSPGFIDTHIHGGMGLDFNGNIIDSKDGDSSLFLSHWEKMEARLSSGGITSILATISSLPPDRTLNAIDRIISLEEGNAGKNRVNIAGIHMEGPYLNKNKKGAMHEEYLRPCDVKEASAILERAKGLVKVWTIAPELDDKFALIEMLSSSGVSVSIAHTSADYEIAMKAFSAGMNRVTHTFNTMPLLSHRYEGIITAAWNHKAFMELITDGQHVSRTVVKMFVAATDPDRIILVSDNSAPSGFSKGKYKFDDRYLFVKDGKMVTETGTLAGNLLTVNQCAYNLVRWGFSEGLALKTITENPARSIGIFNKKGSIECGKDADIAIIDSQFNVSKTIKNGKIVYSKS